jgi:serine/threonine protein kinase
VNIVVNGRYQIIKRLGKGGFAHTYLAKNLAAPGKPTCVVKQLRPHQQQIDDRAIEQFRQEAQVLARFDGDRVPQPIDEFQYQGDFFFVQEFVAGDDLSREFTIGHRWSQGKILDFLLEMLPTVAHIHECDAIHCDLKPNNIIRDWHTGKLKPIDFGAVRDVRSNEPFVTPPADLPIVGTAGYTPPEQIRGEATYASDIYALGMTAIQFATGQYPAHLPTDERGKPIWQDLTAIDPHLATTIDRMVAPDLAERYPDSHAVLQDLHALEIVTERPEETPSPSHSRKAIVGVALLSFLALGTCLSIAQNRTNDDNLVPAVRAGVV